MRGPWECPEGRQEGCRQNKGLRGEGEAASAVIAWGAASLLPPVWASEAPRASRLFRSTPCDNATPTGCPGVVRRVDRPSLDPLAVRLTGLEPPQVAVGPLRLWRLGFKPSAAARGPARVLGSGVGADSLVTASSWIIRDVDGTKVADIRMKGVDQ
jgi:hypothetical protein